MSSITKNHFLSTNKTKQKCKSPMYFMPLLKDIDDDRDKRNGRSRVNIDNCNKRVCARR